jgi:hypothetical protein
MISDLTGFHLHKAEALLEIIDFERDERCGINPP